MPTPVVMPQMGESIAEGTIVRWIKQVGDQVERDEPLFEISTDKVDAEIPSPAAGVLTDIKVQEGETVGVNTVVAEIGQSNEVRGAGSARAPVRSESGPAVKQQPDGQTTPAPTPADKTVSAIKSGQPAAGGGEGLAPSGVEGPSGNGRRRSSPLVRRIAKEHNVDVSQISGSGLGGRVTKHDILDFIQEGHLTAAPATDARTMESRAPQIARPADADRVEKMSVM